MFGIPIKGMIIVVALFLIFLAKAYFEDKKALNQLISSIEECPVCKKNMMGDITDPHAFHTAVIETISYDVKYKTLANSKVKRMIITARDMVVRGAIMGVLEGSVMQAIQNAITWSSAGGIVSGISDMLDWKTEFSDNDIVLNIKQ